MRLLRSPMSTRATSVPRPTRRALPFRSPDRDNGGVRLVEPTGASEIAVAAEDVIELELEDIPGAGYLWSVEVSGPATVEEPAFPTASTDEGAPVGGAVHRTWTIVPTGPGRVDVRGHRGQAWDATQRDRSFSLTVAVVERG